MRALILKIILFFLFAGLGSCYKEVVIFNAEPNSSLELPLILKINNKACGFDYSTSKLRFSIENDPTVDFCPLIEFQEYSTIYFEGKKLLNKTTNNLGKINLNKEYEIIIETRGKVKRMFLSFTNLPIIQIITPNKLYDEPKVLAKIIINYPEINKKSDNSYIGIEYRGAISQSFKKKSFGFSLKKNANLDTDISKSFFELKENHDWILDAMWIDKSRLRNKSSFELWRKINGDKTYAIRSNFVELYINNEHQGLYCFNEKINSQFLNLNSNSVLYKSIAWEYGACFDKFTTNSTLNYIWDGWEQKHPNPKVKINWSPLKKIRQLTVNETNAIFSAQVDSLIDIDNFIDYYLFINLIYAMDNNCKNIFLAQKNMSDKMFIIPWDIDASFGLLWNGTPSNYTSILSNNLFDRLINTNTDNFKTKLKLRWSSLRETIFSNQEVKKTLNLNFELINKSDIIYIENNKWGSTIDYNSEHAYLLNWLENRLVFLDGYFNNL